MADPELIRHGVEQRLGVVDVGDSQSARNGEQQRHRDRERGRATGGAGFLG
jgi:hypothetical protein